MADWKLPVSYNYNPSYHAYAYGLMYPPGTEQNHPNLGWAEAAYNHSGVGGSYYSTPQPHHQSSPKSPENCDNNGHFPGSVVYFADSHTQNGRLFLSHNRSQFNLRPKESEPVSSEAPSDSEAHTPDSWSSSSRERCAPQTTAVSWGEREQDEEDEEEEDDDGDDEGGSGSPDSSAHVSSSLMEEKLLGPRTEQDEQAPLPRLLSPKCQTPAQPRKAKARTAFSESQMSTLTHRFSVQRYLTPVEMKTLAGLTGLTYKQVKTWFQNRRMKLKRHQKDNSWVSERYPNSGYPSIPPQSQFQADSSALIQDHFSAPQFRETIFRKSPSQAPAYYANYPQPPSPLQPLTRAQNTWSLPPTPHYEYNSSGYCGGNGINNSISSDDGTTPDVIENPTNMVMVHNATQWST